MSDLLPITLQDMIAEAEREVVLRKRVYPRWVNAGQLKQEKADRQLAVMKAIVVTLRNMQERQR